jgi:uncharacterized beta-barrel protein YwiB (DUF1934 family)
MDLQSEKILFKNEVALRFETLCEWSNEKVEAIEFRTPGKTKKKQSQYYSA